MGKGWSKDDEDDRLDSGDRCNICGGWHKTSQH